MDPEQPSAELAGAALRGRDTHPERLEHSAGIRLPERDHSCVAFYPLEASLSLACHDSPGSAIGDAHVGRRGMIDRFVTREV